MKTIWKFPLNRQYQKIKAPIERFLAVQKQGDTICVWAVVDPEKEDSSFGLFIIGTGWPLKELAEIGNYIGTVQDGIYVWHIFSEPLANNQKDDVT